ncbi:proline-rich extensin-like protein EPR1 [Portunus trituberculatus]|uniref:proline-rich extensin-like protein EPR1 n=1 Tax=Portunus trituberculatus TaxID=210409 RepID=UPI001E1D0E0A|nr:proline-rich extensin-like protein EPR1 [Portunus trituberculatus]
MTPVISVSIVWYETGDTARLCRPPLHHPPSTPLHTPPHLPGLVSTLPRPLLRFSHAHTRPSRLGGTPRPQHAHYDEGGGEAKLVSVDISLLRQPRSVCSLLAHHPFISVQSALHHPITSPPLHHQFFITPSPIHLTITRSLSAHQPYLSTSNPSALQQPITSPSPSHNQPITPSPSITTPSLPHHQPITTPSPALTTPSPAHHPISTSPSPAHYHPITSPSPHHQPPHHQHIT